MCVKDVCLRICDFYVWNFEDVLQPMFLKDMMPLPFKDTKIRYVYIGHTAVKKKNFSVWYVTMLDV